MSEVKRMVMIALMEKQEDGSFIQPNMEDLKFVTFPVEEMEYLIDSYISTCVRQSISALETQHAITNEQGN